MTDTLHLGLPFIEDSQAQKHVTHNEALRLLDAMIQIAVEDRTRTSPPLSPLEGQRHLVASGAGDAWAGHDDAIATWQDGAWVFLAPNAGWALWSGADGSIFIFDGGAWQPLAPPANNVSLLGVNTTASAPNLLSVKSNAALLAAIPAADGGSGDARLQITKEAAGNTASVFFSDTYAGRAEFGLTGDDDFHLKVSADGVTWQDAFVIDTTTGNVTFNSFSVGAAPIGAFSVMNMFGNGGFEGGAEASASAITLTASGTLQNTVVVDGAAAAYRGSFVASVQQVASPFVGGRYALKYTVSLNQASMGADDELSCLLTVPGLQSAKLALGTAAAQPQSLGFWFQAHRTGAYSGSIRNAAKTRAYPFSFTVTAADTPQWISLTDIAGDTSGAWAIDTSAGMLINICLAAGTSRVGADAAWAGADYSGATGTTNGVAATSDVFYIGNVISVPGSELPDAAHAALAMTPRNDVLRTDAQSLSATQITQTLSNLGASEVGKELFAAEDAEAVRIALDIGAGGDLGADIPWYARGIGEIVYVDTSITGATIPPQSHADLVFVQLTAGLTGSGQYNNSKLTSESVSGSAPLVAATAVISVSGSPIDGETIHLINTESRILRPSTSAGTLQNDQMQQITGGFGGTQEAFYGASGAFTVGPAGGSNRPNNSTASTNTMLFDSANSPNARAGSETRMKNIGITAYMRVK